MVKNKHTPNIKIDKIIRSNRRTLALHVTRDAALVIRAPQRMPLVLIKKFVHKKRSWIEEKQKITRDRFKKLIPKQFIDGEKFLYLGNTYPLSIVDNDAATISFYNGFYLSKKCLKGAKHLFVRWYKNEAAAKIKERLNWYCSHSGFKYNKFNITSAQKRWGSCTPSDNLNFSWRLIMAPLEIIDYVVTHELTHLTEKNHSKRFWEKLSLLFPRFKQCKIWLKENEHLLGIL
jgi:predicted metal-dependent hydrolase